MRESKEGQISQERDEEKRDIFPTFHQRSTFYSDDDFLRNSLDLFGTIKKS